MDTKTLIKKARELLNADKKKQRNRTERIKGVLQKLKEKKHLLKNKLQHEKSEKKRRDIERELKIVSAQRRKGLKVLKKLTMS